jgi:hypothetical protein
MAKTIKENYKYAKQWRLEHKDQWRAYQNKYKGKNKKIISATEKKRYERNKETILLRQKINGQKIKAAAMRMYGGCCAVCKTNELAVMTIDHINNDGTKERKNTNRHLYSRLLKQSIRPDLQVLCFSCQWRKRLYGSDVNLWDEKALTIDFGRNEPVPIKNYKETKI